VIGILTVAIKAVFRKDRPDVAIEFKFLRRGGRVGRCDEYYRKKTDGDDRVGHER